MKHTCSEHKTAHKNKHMETKKKKRKKESEGNNIVKKEGIGLLKENHKSRCNMRRKICKFI